MKTKKLVNMGKAKQDPLYQKATIISYLIDHKMHFKKIS